MMVITKSYEYCASVTGGVWMECGWFLHKIMLLAVSLYIFFQNLEDVVGP